MKKLSDKQLDVMSVVYMVALVLVTVLLITFCGGGKASEAQTVSAMTFSEEEVELISGADSLMRVLTVADSLDLKVLRAVSVDFSEADLQSEHYSALAELMVATVTSPEQDGVGIAAPQVGLNRRVVAVQRFDKEGEPFEVYPNIQIDSLFGQQVYGPEGCLSIPGLRGNVLRYPNVIISYTDPESLAAVKDTVSGYTAVIFQHEVDHLSGILYTDRTNDVTVLPTDEPAADLADESAADPATESADSAAVNAVADSTSVESVAESAAEPASESAAEPDR